MASVEIHRKTLDESIARLLARAGDSRRLAAEDLRGRIEKSVEKYVLRADENVSGQEIREFVDALAADDLCLIVACERNDETAWNDLVAKFDATVKSAARKISANNEDAEDLASSIWAELYGMKETSGGRRGKLGYYSGRGSLAGWLRAVVAQLAVDQFRKDSKFVQIEEDREFENLADESARDSNNAKVVRAAENPEEVLTARQTENDVSAALRAAIVRLAAEDKLIFKLYYFDDLKLREIGATLGFHEATASRKLVRIQAEIRKSVEKILCAEHGWKQEEVKRHLAETASKLDVGLEKLFTLLLIAALVQESFWRGVL